MEVSAPLVFLVGGDGGGLHSLDAMFTSYRLPCWDGGSLSVDATSVSATQAPAPVTLQPCGAKRFRPQDPRTRLLEATDGALDWQSAAPSCVVRPFSGLRGYQQPEGHAPNPHPSYPPLAQAASML